MTHKLKLSLFITFCVLISACDTTPKTPYDYTQLSAKKPTSILVLPPLNNSVDVNASPIYLTTITKPLSERGYYVFPVSIINDLMIENGLPTAAEMHAVPLEKFKEIIDPDAVLYVTINNWGTKYNVISSTTIVDISAKLIDTDSGILLWEGSSAVTYDPNANNQNGLVGILVGAALNQVLSKKFDHSPQVSASANNLLLFTEGQGLLQGPYKLDVKDVKK